MPDTISSKVASAATVIAAATAVAALFIALHQIDVARQIQREASARDAFKEYLKLAMDKPEFADASLGKISKSANSRSGYTWFVSYFLFSAEQIYQSFPNDSEWSAALSHQVCYHKTYLQSNEYQKKLKTHYSQSFAEFVDQSLKGCLN